MGALEVARAALSDVTFAPPPTSESVFLAWLPYVDPLGQPPVTNYRIYYGPALNSVAFIRIVPATQTQTVFDVASDLHALDGAQVCFRLTAVNADGESPQTNGACTLLQPGPYTSPSIAVRRKAMAQLCRVFAPGSNKLTTGLTAQSAQRTWVAWMRQDGLGGGNFGRLFDKRSTGGIQNEELLHSSDNTKYLFVRGWTTSTDSFAQWQIDNPDDATIHHFAVTYDSGSTANDPVMYLDGVSKSVTEVQSPSGAAVTSAEPYTIGNRADDTRGWDGMICEFAVWNSILNSTQIASLAAGASPLDVSPGTLIAYFPMHNGDSPEPDVVGSADATVLGTTTEARVSPVPDYFNRLVEVVGETVQTAEATLRVLGLARVRDEPVSLSESILRSLGLSRASGESVSVSEQTARNVGAVRVRDETEEISETVSRNEGIARITSETVSVAEDIASFIGRVANRQETVSVDDETTQILGQFSAFDETVALAGSSPATLGKTSTSTEGVDLSESISRIFGFRRIVTESVSIAESVALVLLDTSAVFETAIDYVVRIREAVQHFAKLSPSVNYRADLKKDDDQ